VPARDARPSKIVGYPHNGRVRKTTVAVCVWLWVGLIGLVLAIGCDRPSDVIGLGPLPPRPTHVVWDPDASTGEDAGLPEGTRPCEVDADCDDGIACTVDSCLPGQYCSNLLDHGYCSDGLICNGVESCDPELGCIAGPRPACDDQNACTLDSCDEESKACVHAPRDSDRDGEVDVHCPGGTDCDDFDPTRGANVPEICGDGLDNDCDDLVDESECGRAVHDTCSDALDVSAGGTFAVTNVGALADYSLSCTGEGVTRDLVFTLVLERPRDVAVVAAGLRDDGTDDSASVALQSECGNRDSELQCASGYPSHLRVRALPAGRYSLIVAVGSAASTVVLDVTLSDPTSAPSNSTCASALDVSAGGSFQGNFVDVPNSATSSCDVDTRDQPDLFYKLMLKRSQDVEVSAVADDGELTLALFQGNCQSNAREQRCFTGPRVLSHFYQLPAGEYMLLVEGPGDREIDFGLDITLSPPTPPPAGDTCAAALPIPLDTTRTVTLTGFQDDIATTCASSVDAVLSFTLDEGRDITVDVDGHGSSASAVLQSQCGVIASELLDCRTATPLSTRRRYVPAGTYYLVVSSAAATRLDVRVNAFEAIPTTRVSGNDTCANAVDVPESGGAFEGDTSALKQDYYARCGGGALSADAVYRLVLSERKHVTATVDASFDSVLYRYPALVAGQAACPADNEAACDDDGAGASGSQLSEVLDPGIYYYIVDGYGESSVGSYTFAVTVMDP